MPVGKYRPTYGETYSWNELLCTVGCFQALSHDVNSVSLFLNSRQGQKLPSDVILSETSFFKKAVLKEFVITKFVQNNI